MRPSWRGRVRCARASTGRSFLYGGEGSFVSQSRGRYTGVGPFVRCLDELWALKAEKEGQDGGRLAEDGLTFGGVQATLMAARGPLYQQWEMMGGRQASQERMEVAVKKRLFVAQLWTLSQKLFMPHSAEEFLVRRWAT